MFFVGWTFPVAATLLFCAVAASACSKVQARTPAAVPVDPPPLATPDPPSRQALLVSVDPPAAAASTPEKPPAGSTNRGNPAPIPPAAGSSAPPPATLPDPPTTPVIQAGADVEQRSRDRLKQAESDLKRVQRASLSADAKEQYDSAQRFVRMANEAIRAKNFVYAGYCADKAATLASLLVKEGGRVPHA